MSAPEQFNHSMFLGIAQALFVNRLHVLRLTEIVRLHIQPDDLDGDMSLPPKIDGELKEQAVAYVLNCFPHEFHEHIHQAQKNWITPA